jgi:Leucine-rich repeat (LRR) protein
VIDDEIEKLSSLEKLQLSKNRISTLPPPLFSLSNLSFLDLSDNDISDLPKKIENLENLQELLLSKNQIYSLPSDLLALSKLTNLDVRFCRVEHIPPEVGMMTSLKSLKIAGNNLKTPPAEIASKGLAATMSFLRSLCGSDLQLSYQIKVSVVGPPSSGKTSVVAKLNNSSDGFSKLPSTSISILDSTVLGLLRQTPTNLKMCEVPTVLSVNATRATKKQVTFNVWEFEGSQEYTHISHKVGSLPFFLLHSSLF